MTSHHGRAAKIFTCMPLSANTATIQAWLKSPRLHHQRLIPLSLRPLPSLGVLKLKLDGIDDNVPTWTKKDLLDFIATVNE